MPNAVFRVNATNHRSLLFLGAGGAAIALAIHLWGVGATTGWVVALALTCLLAGIAAHMQLAKIQLRHEGLRVGAGFYTLTVPWSDIVEVSNPGEKIALRWRVNGVSVPGFALGWFRLDDRRLVFAASGPTRSTIRIRLRGDFDLIVSTLEGAALLAALRARAWRAGMR